MADIVIPKDRIPVDIIKRLQAIGQSMGKTAVFSPSAIFTPAAATTFTSSSSSSSPPLSSTCWTSLPQSPSLLSAPRFQQLQVSRPSSVTFDFDEVDGGLSDSVLQFSRSSPQKRSVKDILDNSGIVRIFPSEDDDDEKNMANQATKLHDGSEKSMEEQTHNDSEIVRIFPQRSTQKNGVDESNIVRVLTPTSTHNRVITTQSESAQILANSRQSSSSCNVWNFASESQRQSFMPSNEMSPQPACHSTPKRPLNTNFTRSVSPRPSPSSVSPRPSPSSVSPRPSPSSVSPRPSPSFPDMQLSATRHQMNEHSRSIKYTELTSGVSVNPRRSPGLPTPPQTPDDGDVDDDEVFTYSVPNRDDVLYRTFTTEPNTDSTTRRHTGMSRHNSDRSGEVYRRLANHSFHSGSTHYLDPSFGDRLKTRKRLSFDENSASPCKQPRPCHHSEPTSVSSHRCGSPRNLVLGGTSQKCNLDPNKADSPQRSYPTAGPTSTFPKEHQQAPNQKVASVSQVHLQPPPGPRPTAVSTAEVQNVFKVLEGVVRQQLPAPSPRTRLLSDGDEIQHASLERSPPIRDGQSRRRQTFSGCKSRCEGDGGVQFQGSTATSQFQGSTATNQFQGPTTPNQFQGPTTPNQFHSPTALSQFQVPWPHEHSGEPTVDCACSKIARSVLQMVEGTYRRLNEVDLTVAGLAQFRQELSQTNDILRESLTIVQQFRAMCGHSPRHQTSDLSQ